MDGTTTMTTTTHPHDAFGPDVDLFGRHGRAAATPSQHTAWSTGAAGLGLFGICLLLLAGAVGGCADADRPTSLVPNSDPALRKTKREFSADALKRHPYHADAPRAGKAHGGATVDYDLNTLQVANFTPEDWKNVEVWVNGQWVVFVPLVPGNAASAKTIDFTMLYDQMARPFPAENTTKETMVRKVEIYKDGKMYELAGLTAE